MNIDLLQSITLLILAITSIINTNNVKDLQQKLREQEIKLKAIYEHITKL